MTLLQLSIVALVQGITEFLPISSSGHLILIPHLSNWPDQGRLIDVAVHLGTLGAVVMYVWRDIVQMFKGLIGFSKGDNRGGLSLFGQICLATLPVVIAGFFIHKLSGNFFRSLEVVAWATFGFGLLLWIGDRLGMTIRRVEHMTWGTALVIGLAQVLALVPGASRAGVTITMARFLGFERREAARFSMLLAIPAILGASLLSGLELLETDDLSLTYDAAIAAALAFVSALIAIAVMMSWLRRATFTPFIVYRLLLGLGLLALVYQA